ncbi:MAG: hypothetical protein ACK4N4_10430 [Burkholderiales bacterium]
MPGQSDKSGASHIMVSLIAPPKIVEKPQPLLKPRPVEPPQSPNGRNPSQRPSSPPHSPADRWR